MMKMWDIATSNQGGRGLASFVGTVNEECGCDIHVISKSGGGGGGSRWTWVLAMVQK